MLLCTSCSLLMPHTCPSLHPWFSPAFCASCAMFYLCITLPTALLNTSPCFALSCFHYSASPSFPVLLPQMLFSSLSWQYPNPCTPFCPPDLLCLFLVQLLVLICPLPPSNRADWWSPSIPCLNSGAFYMVLEWHIAIQFQPLLSLKCPRVMEVQLQAQGSRLSMWQHHQSLWGDLSEARGAVDIGKAAHGQARCVKQDPLAGLGRMWGAEGSGERAWVAGRGLRWRLPCSSKVAFWTALLLPARLWGLLFPAPLRQQELT